MFSTVGKKQPVDTIGFASIVSKGDAKDDMGRLL